MRWEKPYQTQQQDTNWLEKYCVTFENEPLLLNMNRSYAKQLAAALNGAYNLGKMNERLNTELEKNKSLGRSWSVTIPSYSQPD